MQKKYGCKVAMLPPSDDYRALLGRYFPNIELVRERPEDVYTSCCLAVFQKLPYLIAVDSSVEGMR